MTKRRSRIMPKGLTKEMITNANPSKGAAEFAFPRTAEDGISLANLGLDIGDWYAPATTYATEVASGNKELDPVTVAMLSVPILGPGVRKTGQLADKVRKGSRISKSTKMLGDVPYDYTAARQRQLVNDIDARLLDKSLSEEKIADLMKTKRQILQDGNIWVADPTAVRQEIDAIDNAVSPKAYREDLRAGKIGDRYFDEGGYYSTAGDFYELEGHNMSNSELADKLHESITNTEAKLYSPLTPNDQKPALSKRIENYQAELNELFPKVGEEEAIALDKLLDEKLGMTPSEKFAQSNKNISNMLDEQLSPVDQDYIFKVDNYDVDGISPFRISNYYTLKALGLDAENATRAKIRELNRQSQSNYGKVEKLEPPRKADYTSPDSKKAFDRSELVANHFVGQTKIGNPVFSPDGKLLQVTPFEPGVQTKLITPENATDAAILRHRYSNYNQANAAFNKQIAADIKAGKIPGYKVKYVPYDNGTAAMIIDDTGNMYNPHDLFKEKYNAFIEANFPGYIKATKTPKRR